jgi:DNA adenine methylase
MVSACHEIISSAMGREPDSEPYSKAAPESEIQEVTPARAPFGYYGAKLRIVSRLTKCLPPHNAWVEAFCGSAALTLAKKAAPIEVINDLNGEIVNVFEQLRDNADAVCRAIALTPYARAEFLSARAIHPNGDDLERARRFLVTSMMTVNGTYGSTSAGFSFSPSYARECKEARVSRWYNLPERLTRVVERLRNVRVENRDARELLRMFADRPATLVYLDPPYFVKRSHRYVIDASDESFHRELLEICIKARCMIILSGYENPLYDSILVQGAGWTRDVIETKTRDTSGKDYGRTEVLWKNSFFMRGVRTGKIPIRLSAKERAMNKINPPRKR